VHRCADNSRPVSFTVGAWEWVYATDLSRLQRETREREWEREKQTARGRSSSVLITTILLPSRLSCFWGKIMSLRMLTNLRLADLRLTTEQQRSTAKICRPTCTGRGRAFEGPAVPSRRAGWTQCGQPGPCWSSLCVAHVNNNSVFTARILQPKTAGRYDAGHDWTLITNT
jgi:hypothetical protein